MKPTKRPASVEEYIAQYPPTIQKLLRQMRTTIRKVAPDAQELLSYGMPAYKQYGMLTYFAAHTHHIGMYPMPSALRAFSKELALYAAAKSTLQFPLNKPLPTALISKVVKWRVMENEEKAGVAFLRDLPAPAQRALNAAGITDLKKLSRWSQAKLLELHGVGPSTLPKLRAALQKHNLSFKK